MAAAKAPVPMASMARSSMDYQSRLKCRRSASSVAATARRASELNAEAASAWRRFRPWAKLSKNGALYGMPIRRSTRARMVDMIDALAGVASLEKALSPYKIERELAVAA